VRINQHTTVSKPQNPKQNIAKHTLFDSVKKVHYRHFWASKAFKSWLLAECDFQICLNVASLSGKIVSWLVICRFTSIYFLRTINLWTPRETRLNSDTIFGIGRVIYLWKIIVDHIKRATIRVAFVPETSAVLYLGNFRASPFSRDLDGARYKVLGEAESIRKGLFGPNLCVEVCGPCHPFNV